MSSTDPRNAPNRRRSRRRDAKRKIKVFCRNSLDLGKNNAQAVLDMSETGVRLQLNASLPVGAEVTITFESPVLVKPVVRKGQVVWCTETADGISAGVQFEKSLPYDNYTTLVGL